MSSLRGFAPLREIRSALRAIASLLLGVVSASAGSTSAHPPRLYGECVKCLLAAALLAAWSGNEYLPSCAARPPLGGHIAYFASCDPSGWSAFGYDYETYTEI